MCGVCGDILEDLVGADKASEDPVAPEAWQPLSARHGGTPIDQTWHEGVPAWHAPSLRTWLSAQLRTERVRNRLYARLDQPDDLLDPVAWLDSEGLLDWVDGVLNLNAEERNPIAVTAARELETSLREGNSVWKVSDALDALERRQDATVSPFQPDCGGYVTVW
jgi:hypothetical protein